MITIIAALSQDSHGRYVIGKDGDIPWKSRTDMQHFAKKTSNHPVIMGRKTWESLPDKFKPLPNRMNYVLTKSYHIFEPGVITSSSLENALEQIANKTPPMEGIDYTNPFVIGGSSIYQESLQIADRLELTFIHKSYEGDTYFPNLDFKNINKGNDKIWQLVKEIKPTFKNQEKALTFRTYERK